MPEGRLLKRGGDTAAKINDRRRMMNPVRNPAYRPTVFLLCNLSLVPMNEKIKRALTFITVDIWRVTEDEVGKKTFMLVNVLKATILAIRRFTSDRIPSKASALTYSTILAIVPMLAVVFAIARGFGLEGLLIDSFGHDARVTDMVVGFVNSYLQESKNGIFVGVGLVLLFWTVTNLVINIETNFNSIWEIKQRRSLYRQVTDYFSLFLLIPILLILSSGISIFITTSLKEMPDYIILSSILKFLIKMIPYALTWLMFTGLYMFMPNTKVKFSNAFIAGVLAGTAYQVFQYIYINGQIYVSKYNAIYGSFAALPLLLLWLQISWTICLIGVEVTYLAQNVRNFDYERDTNNISRRFRDFVCVLFLSLIVRRFVAGQKPYSASELSEETKTPARLAHQVLNLLQQLDIIHTTTLGEGKKEEVVYMPSVPVEKLTVGLVMERINNEGSEDFRIDREEKFSDEWRVLLDVQKVYYDKCNKILIKDL